jgi:O-antigen ligase
MLTLLGVRSRPRSPWSLDDGLWRWSVSAFKLLVAVAFCVLVGLTVGVMTVILPPLASIGVVALAGLVLLWAMPDLPVMSETTLRRLFFWALVVQFTVPVYFAFAVQGLPWVSIRRITWLPLVLVSAVMLASSSEMRGRVWSTMSAARPISYPLIGFFVWMWVSLFTSISWPETLTSIWNSYVYWLMAFVICLMAVRNEKDVGIVVLMLCFIAVAGGTLGFIEYMLQNHFIGNLWPDSMMRQLFANNPIVLEMITRELFRNGEFRANFIYNVSLSYGELMAMIAPIALYLVLHSGSPWRRLLGVLAVGACILGVYASGARGGYAGLALGLPFTAVLWLIRHMRKNPSSMAGMIGGVSLLGAITGFVTLAIAWKRLRWKFTGGWEGAGSDSVRMLQWNMATPNIIASPLTGYGHGVGGIKVGYVTPRGLPTVDSYMLTLLVDLGVPGLILFFSMLIAAIFLLMQTYLRDDDPESEVTAGLAGALLAFAAYRLVLSQQENHHLLLVFLAMAMCLIANSKRRLSQKR